MSGQETAETTLRQLGGNKFMAMTGAKELGFDADGTLTFKIGRNCNGVNYVTVKLTSMDVYDMKFEHIRMKKYELTRKTIKEYNGVYADQLQELFTEATGMNTRL